MRATASVGRGNVESSCISRAIVHAPSIERILIFANLASLREVKSRISPGAITTSRRLRRFNFYLCAGQSARTSRRKNRNETEYARLETDSKSMNVITMSNRVARN